MLDFAIAGLERDLVIGIGLGGIEQGYPPRLFERSYAAARAAGLRVVAHAGEAAGPESIREAIESLRIERVGHGVRCLEDPDLVRELAISRIPIEVCPTSNYLLGIVPPDAPHPIRKMLDAGLNVSVHTDDPAMFGTSLSDELQLLNNQGFAMSEISELLERSAHARFR